MAKLSPLSVLFLWIAGFGVWLVIAKVAWPTYPHVPICGVFTTFGGACGAVLGHPRMGAAVAFVAYWTVVIGSPGILGIPLYV